jgi:hypothetical protein
MKALATVDVNKEIDEQLSIEANLATDEKKEARLAICLGCPFLKNQTCLKCGCYARFRASLEQKYCPIGKWK